MYNLLMVGHSGYWDERTASDFEWSRFLEHTVQSVKNGFLPIDESRITELINFPTLFAYEFEKPGPRRVTTPLLSARLGRITNISQRQRGIHFSYEFLPQYDKIPMDVVASLAADLDINLERGENYRSHWAVKDIDLIALLSHHGLYGENPPVAPDIAVEIERLDVLAPIAGRPKPQIFVVHGRDDGVKNEIARWLNRIGMDETVLHEQPNLGRSIITKFRDVTERASFAVVIATPDDVGGLAGEAQSARARQNVVFELGFFRGTLGPERVALIRVGEIELPSDYQGVLFIPYDRAGAWKLALAKEFISLDIPFDAHAALG